MAQRTDDIYLAQEEHSVIQASTKDQPVEVATFDVARDKIFGLTELNEILANVLVHLPPRNIFEVQRVSRSFINAVERSPEIQEKLFLRQRKAIKNVLANAVEHTQPTLNRINPLFHQVKMLGKIVGIDSRKCVSLESTILDTYLLDTPCGKIGIDVAVHDHRGRLSIVFEKRSHIVDTGKTLRDLMEPILREERNLVVRNGKPDYRDQSYHRCSAYEIIRQWQQADGWRTTVYVGLIIWLED